MRGLLRLAEYWLVGIMVAAAMYQAIAAIFVMISR